MSVWLSQPSVEAFSNNAASISAVSSEETLADKIDSTAYMGDDYEIYEAYENGQPIKTAKVSTQAQDFIDGYVNYDLSQQGLEFIPENDGMTVVYTQPEEAQYDRSATMQHVIDVFGVDTSDNEYDTIMATGNRIWDKMYYSTAYMSATLDDAVDAGYGVCWHYARIAYVLLNAEGIPTRIRSGLYYGGAHAWNECYINGSWVLVDYTNYQLGIVPLAEADEYQEQSTVTYTHSFSN